MMSKRNKTRRRGHRKGAGGLLLLAAGVVLLPACATQGERRVVTPPPAPSGAQAVAGAVTREMGELRRRLLPQIQKARQQYGIPGISLALVQDGRVVWSEGFGYADRERGLPATPNTVYRAGSLAKLFTAMAVMRLEDQGEIDIDQPLSAYLPEFAIRGRFTGDAEPITPRSILCHHSGLPTDLKKGMWAAGDFTRVANALREEYAAYPPNLIFSYSNVGYTLLGHMVERQTGRPFTRYMREQLYTPLGMRHTGHLLRDTAIAQLAVGYRDGEPAEALPIRDLPAYSLYTSVNDLARFIQSIQAGERPNTPLSGSAMEEMMSDQNAEIPLDMDVRTGLGWFIEQGSVPGAGRLVRHGGTTLLYGSELILAPEHGFGVAVMANAAGSRPVVKQLAEAVLRGALGDTAVAVKPEQAKSDPPDDLALYDQGARPIEADGRYATQIGMVAIEAEKERICACMMDKRMRLVPLPGGRFRMDDDGRPMPAPLKALGRFQLATREIGGREVIVASKGARNVLLGEKVAPKRIDDRWRARTGRYTILNPDDGYPVIDATVREEEGSLCLSYRMPQLTEARIRVPLQPVSDDEAVILGLGRGRGETVRFFEEDGVLKLRYSGYVARWVGE